MANLSGHGVKMVLPSLLTALDEDQWRTKAGKYMSVYIARMVIIFMPGVHGKYNSIISAVKKGEAKSLKQPKDVISL